MLTEDKRAVGSKNEAVGAGLIECSLESIPWHLAQIAAFLQVVNRSLFLGPLPQPVGGDVGEYEAVLGGKPQRPFNPRETFANDLDFGLRRDDFVEAWIMALK